MFSSSLDSGIKKSEDYYPQVFLKESKYINKKVIRNIIDDIKISSDDSDDSDEENVSDKYFKLATFHFNCH